MSEKREVNIFFTAHLARNSMSGWHRAKTLEKLGYAVTWFPYGPYHKSQNWIQRALTKLTKQVFAKQDIIYFNQDFLKAFKRTQPDIAWVEKPLMLLPETLNSCKKVSPNCLFVCFQDDDPLGRGRYAASVWKYFTQILPLFDLHFVKKDIDLLEFKQAGAQRVIKFRGGYFSDIFKPVYSEADQVVFKWPISFIGTALDYRILFVKELLCKYKIDLNIFGEKWDRQLFYYTKRAKFHPPVHGEEYANTIGNSKISLGFVSLSNRDDYTTRSFEIPACKGFFLGQRTKTHQELYQEGEEAEFFDSVDECADKVRYYLAHDSARLKIAAAGYRRCIESDYSYEGSLRQAMDQVLSIIGAKIKG
jgi:spore maturation protein CgeB